MAGYTHIQRTFGPVFDESSKILILGSFPSASSRKVNFYYGHPQNRFWRLISDILESPVPESIEEKKALLLKKHVALWDTLDSCDIIGSSDSSIKNAVPVDIMRVLSAADIKHIFCNGTASYTMFLRYITPVCGIVPEKLPSTSPANAAFTYERLLAEWRKIGQFL